MAYSFESISHILGYSVVKVQNFKSIEAKEIKSPSISKGQQSLKSVGKFNRYFYLLLISHRKELKLRCLKKKIKNLPSLESRLKGVTLISENVFYLWVEFFTNS